MADEIIINGSESEEVEISVVPEGDAAIPVTVSSDTETVIPVVDTPTTQDVQVEVTEDTDPEQVETAREWREILSYLRLVDKPSIDEVTLEYDKSFEELGLTEITNMELDALLED